MWIGRRSQYSDIYIPEAVGAVTDNSGSIVFDKTDGVVSENSVVSGITKLANVYEVLAGNTREKADTTGISEKWGEREVRG